MVVNLTAYFFARLPLIWSVACSRSHRVKSRGWLKSNNASPSFSTCSSESRAMLACARWLSAPTRRASSRKTKSRSRCTPRSHPISSQLVMISIVVSCSACGISWSAATNCLCSSAFKRRYVSTNPARNLLFSGSYFKRAIIRKHSFLTSTTDTTTRSPGSAGVPPAASACNAARTTSRGDPFVFSVFPPHTVRIASLAQQAGRLRSQGYASIPGNSFFLTSIAMHTGQKQLDKFQEEFFQ